MLKRTPFRVHNGYELVGGLNCFPAVSLRIQHQVANEGGEGSSEGPPPIIKFVGVMKESLVKLLENFRYLFLRE